MFFILVPYAVDVPFDRRPVVNWVLVITIVAAFLFQIPALTGQYGAEEKLAPYVLDGWHLPGLVSHLWLHANPIHLAGNMLFLWIFGNAVCAKVGNLKYLPIYLLFGLAAATAHLLCCVEPAVGASGAINGIVGMFLVFFWQNEMDCMFCGIILIRPVYRTFSVPSYVMIILWLMFDIWGAVVGGGQVAYAAHLGGFFAGALLAIVLIKLGWVRMYADEQSLVDLFDQWRQDRQDAKLMQAARNAVDRSAENEPDWESVANHQPAADQAAGDDDVPVAIPVDRPVQRKPVVLHFICACGQKIQAPIHHAGRTGCCPQCHQRITIPIPTAEEC